MARFTTSAGKSVPGSTDRQWKRLKRQPQLAAEHNPIFNQPEQQQHLSHRSEFGDNSFNFKPEQHISI